MDSISDVLRQMITKDMQDAAKDRIDYVLNHPLMMELKKKHPSLDDSTLKLNMARFNEYISDNERCKKCPGLDECGNSLQGHYTEVEIGDGNWVTERKVSCRLWKQRMNQERISKRIKSFYMDESIVRSGFDIEEMIRKDPDRARAVFQVAEYVAKTKKEGLQNKGLFLTGDFGTGKTYLMSYLLYELAQNGHTGIIIYLPDFCEDLKAMFSETKKMTETVELLKQADILVLDDIGAENLNPWFRDHVLGSILNYRMNRKPTFYTSNYDLETLGEHLSFTNREGLDENKGKRLMERIKHYTDQIYINGYNKRYSK